jgi:hypothetical protein
MSEQALSPFDLADDGYESHYAEKLWSWIPELYHTLDLEAPNPGVLRAIVEVVARQAAILRRDIDRVWDDQAIELCDDWAISYLGELVGAVPLSGFNARGNRLATAKAVYYQRRKGTPAVMQELIRDIAGLEGAVVEAFRRLVRFPHRLDIGALGRGTVTGTPAGGLVDLRTPRVKGLTDTAFDEAAHFPDMRRLRGPVGRYGLRKVNFHLSPLRSFPVGLPTPVAIAPGRFTLDPSGREVALWQRGQTSDRPPDAIREEDLPDAILCRRFNATRHALSVEALAEIDDPGLDTALAPLLGVTFRDAASFRRTVSGRLTPAQVTTFLRDLLDATLVDSPKAVLWPDSVALALGSESSVATPSAAHVIAADLDDWDPGTLDAFVELAVDPNTGRVVPGGAAPAGRLFAQRLHYGQFAPLGSGTYGRAGGLTLTGADDVDAGATGAGGGFTSPGPVAIALPDPFDRNIRFSTSRTYQPSLPGDRTFDEITDTVIEAADGARPYVLFRPDGATLDITFAAAAPVAGETRTLTIDGVWLGLMADTVVPEIVAPAAAATPVTARLILRGDFDRVSLRNLTLDPGGERARNVATEAVAIPYVRLEIEGQVSHLEITRCITGPIVETEADADLCNAGTIEICDSLVQSIAHEPAIVTRLGRVTLTRSTVLGDVEVARLHASDSIVDGRIRVTDNQNGCLRYSATGDAAGTAVLPPQFECLVVAGSLPSHWIASRRFGSAWYGALSTTAPESILRGGSNGAEMGVFNGRGLAILLDDLASQVRRLMPVGQTPQYIMERDQEVE